MKDTPQTTWPRISIGGEKDLEVKYTFMVTYRMSKQGVDMRDLGKFATTMATHMAVFALCVEHNFAARQRAAPTADEWAEKIGEHEEDPDGAFTKVAEVVLAAFKLARPKAKPVAKTPAAPPAQDQPIQ